jgi:hypothetical protein
MCSAPRRADKHARYSVRGDPNGVFDWKAAVGFEAMAQRLTLNQRHGVEGHSVRVARREKRNDVWMVEAREQLYFPGESLDGNRARVIGRQHLHDNLASEAAVFRDEHARHPAATELALDGVGAVQCVLQLEVQVRHRGRSPEGGPWSRASRARAARTRGWRSGSASFHRSTKAR